MILAEKVNGKIIYIIVVRHTVVSSYSQRHLDLDLVKVSF